MNINDLQLFSDGGEGGSAEVEGSAASSASGGGGTTPQSSEMTAPLTQGSLRETSESDISGTGDTVKNAENDKGESYQAFKEKYKNEFQKDFNNVFAKRFKGMKETEEKLKYYDAALEPLLKKYEAEDVQELVDKIRTDPANFTEAAYENGTTPQEEAAKEIIKLNKERNEAKRQEEAKRKADREKIEGIRRNIEVLKAESLKVKEIYPDFDIIAERKNPSFVKMVEKGVPMIDAYRCLHIDDIIAKEVSKATKATQEALRVNSQRPSEVGTDGSKTVKSEFDVNSLTGEEIDDIMERVIRGEKISFAP